MSNNNVIQITLSNRLAAPTSVFFLRATKSTDPSKSTDFDKLFADRALSLPLLGSQHECTGKSCVGNLPGCYKCNPENSNTRTFVFEILTGHNLSLYMPATGAKLISCVIWAASYENANNPAFEIPKGPQIQTETELTIDASKIDFDISFVEGVSYTGKIEFRQASSGNVTQTTGGNLNPPPPALFSEIVKVFQNENRVHSDKNYQDDQNTLGPEYGGMTKRALAACGDNMGFNNPYDTDPDLSKRYYSANKPTGQHLCRKWFYDHNQENINAPNLVVNEDTYCNWLRKNNTNSYCWALDELFCVDTDCGYRPLGSGSPDDKPSIEDSGFDNYVLNITQPVAKPVNVYSCGSVLNRDAQPGYGNIDGKYWGDPGGSGLGCITNTVTVPNANFTKEAGEIFIEFIELPWLNGKNPPSGGTHPLPPIIPVYSSNASSETPTPTTPSSNTLTTTILVVAGSVILIIIIVFLFYYIMVVQRR